MWITYLLIVVILVIAELSYFKISDKYIIVDKQKNGRCTLQTYCKEVIYEELYGAWYTFFELGWRGSYGWIA